MERLSHYIHKTVNSNDTLHWITSAGGSLILLSQHLLKQWMGCFLLSKDVSNLISPYDISLPESTFAGEETETDYDRACAVEGYLGIIKVANGEGLILAGYSLVHLLLKLAEHFDFDQ
ncbi:MAG: Imm21 family immunity protein [Acidobacteriota bacterium]